MKMMQKQNVPLLDELTEASIHFDWNGYGKWMWLDLIIITTRDGSEEILVAYPSQWDNTINHVTVIPQILSRIVAKKPPKQPFPIGWRPTSHEHIVFRDGLSQERRNKICRMLKVELVELKIREITQ